MGKHHAIKRMISSPHKNEDKIVEFVRKSIITYWINYGSGASLSLPITCIKQSKISDNYKKELLAIVVKFCPFFIKKDKLGNEMLDESGLLVIKKDQERYSYKFKTLLLEEGDRDSLIERLNSLIDQYINARGGSIFGVARDINKDQVWVKEHYRTTANDHVLVTGHWRNC